jgi:hypothetical protein
MENIMGLITSRKERNDIFEESMQKNIWTVTPVWRKKAVMKKTKKSL